MKWNIVNSEADLENAIEASNSTPSAIFKHSTRCPTSFMAKRQLEALWDFDASEVQPYFIDLIAYRAVSNRASELSQVPHESPQMLLVKNGKVIYHASHGSISTDEMKRAISELA